LGRMIMYQPPLVTNIFKHTTPRSVAATRIFCMRGLKAICCVKDAARKAYLQNTTTAWIAVCKTIYRAS
jgi:hypothetical protein